MQVPALMGFHAFNDLGGLKMSPGVACEAADHAIFSLKVERSWVPSPLPPL